MGPIVEDPEDEAAFPTVPAGVVDPAWLTVRVAATARLTGRFCAVTAARPLAALHPVFIGPALRLGLKDFDAAALKDARSRVLTQRVARHLYATTTLDGAVFQSRHSDDITLWAVFERPGDPPISPCLADITRHELHVDRSEVTRAMDLLGLLWHTSVDPDSGRKP